MRKLSDFRIDSIALSLDGRSPRLPAFPPSAPLFLLQSQKGEGAGIQTKGEGKTQSSLDS